MRDHACDLVNACSVERQSSTLKAARPAATSARCRMLAMQGYRNARCNKPMLHTERQRLLHWIAERHLVTDARSHDIEQQRAGAACDRDVLEEVCKSGREQGTAAGVALHCLEDLHAMGQRQRQAFVDARRGAASTVVCGGNCGSNRQRLRK